MTVALLTARGFGSWPGKNMALVGQKPLCRYPMEAAKAVGEIEDFFLSSESEEILNLGKDLGYKPIQRPGVLSEDQTQHAEVLKHSLQEMKTQGIEPEILVVLLGNSGTIKPKWIRECVQIMKREPGVTAVVPVLQDQDHHPFRAKTLDVDGYLIPHPGIQPPFQSNRQELSKNFFLCHNFWVLRPAHIYENDGLGPWNFMGPRVRPYPVEEGFDVHTPGDLNRTEQWIRENISRKHEEL